MTWNLRPLHHLEAKYISGALAVLAACLIGVPLAHAGIVSTFKVTQVSPPVAAGGVKPGATVTFPDPIVFQEVANGIMPSNMPVDALIVTDFTTRPVVSGGVIDSSLVPGVIPVGTPFDSYFFHFDPGTNGGYPSSGSIPADIHFSTQILGLQLFGVGAGSPSPTGRLGDGDAISPLGANKYPGPTSGSPSGTDNSPTRGVESGDSLGIYLGRTDIQFAGLAFSGQIDQVRIFVSAVPEPASLAMAFVAIFGIMGLGRTRSRAVRS
jgi:hypothetical protein